MGKVGAHGSFGRSWSVDEVGVSFSTSRLVLGRDTCRSGPTSSYFERDGLRIFSRVY